MNVQLWNLTVILLLVAGVLHGHDGQDEVSHAMVLDILDKDNDKLIFKNTYDQEGQPKKVEVGRTHPNAPEELYFVHLEVKDIDNLPGQKKREKLKEAEYSYDSDDERSCSLCCFC